MSSSDRDARSTRGGYMLFDHSFFPDAVIVRVGGRNFMISRSYLALQSPFFHHLFYGPDANQGGFKLDGDPGTFGDLLDMIYPCYKKTNCCVDCSSSLEGRLSLALQLKLRFAIRRLIEDNINSHAHEVKRILQENNAWNSYSHLFPVNDRIGIAGVNAKKDFSDSLEPLTATLAFPDATTVVAEGIAVLVSATTLALHSQLGGDQLYKDGDQVHGVKIGLSLPSFATFLRATTGDHPDLTSEFLDDLCALGAVQLYDYYLSKVNERLVAMDVEDASKCALKLLKHFSTQSPLNMNSMKQAVVLLSKNDLNTFLAECTSLAPADRKILADHAEPKQSLQLTVVGKDRRELKVKCEQGLATTLRTIKMTCEAHFGIAAAHQIFCFSGGRLWDNETLEDQNVEEGDIIEIYEEQSGC